MKGRRRTVDSEPLGVVLTRRKFGSNLEITSSQSGLRLLVKVVSFKVRGREN